MVVVYISGIIFPVQVMITLCNYLVFVLWNQIFSLLVTYQFFQSLAKENSGLFSIHN